MSMKKSLELNINLGGKKTNLKSKLYAHELAGLKLESNSRHPENPSVLRARFDQLRPKTLTHDFCEN